MEALKYFVRSKPDGFVFKFFSPVHFLILAGIIAVSFLIVKNREYLKTEKGRKYKLALVLTLVAVQVANYSWFILSGNFTISDSLPLYTCRVAIYAMILTFITKNEVSETISIYWGIFGGIFGNLLPVLYFYHFPHITNFTYFLGHAAIVWSVVWFIAVTGYTFSRKNLVRMLAITNIFCIFINWFDFKVNGNYSYFTFSPVLTKFFQRFSPHVYDLIVIVIYNLLVLLIHFTGHSIQKRYQKNNEPGTRKDPKTDESNKVGDLELEL